MGGSWSGRLAVADPARCAATAFRGVLEAKGIRVMGGVATSREPRPDGVRALAAHDSPSMAEMIRVVNKESQNLHAETLLRLVGLKVEGRGQRRRKGTRPSPSSRGGSACPTTGWGLADGSGLARTDLLTPRGLVALLAAMDRHPYAAAFRDSLPIAGVDGTLEKRMKGTPAEGRVTAKTGALRLANALAGLRDDAAGRAAGVRDRGEQPRGKGPRGGGGHRRDRGGAGRGALKPSRAGPAAAMIRLPD